MCASKDPGFAVDRICPGNIADFVAIYLGHAVWRDVAEKAISIEGDRQMARQLPTWLRLDKVPGRNFSGCTPGRSIHHRRNYLPVCRHSSRSARLHLGSDDRFGSFLEVDRRGLLSPGERTSSARPLRSEKCHVWTAPAVQEESNVSAKRSGAAMYPAFECSRFGCWP
jgi:hypothetical protein